MWVSCVQCRKALVQWTPCTASKFNPKNELCTQKGKLVSSAAALWWFSCRGCVRWNCLLNTSVTVEGRLWAGGSAVMQSSLRASSQVEHPRQPANRACQGADPTSVWGGTEGRPVTAFWSAGWGFYWKLFPHFCPCFSGLFIVFEQFSSTVTFFLFPQKQKILLNTRWFTFWV